MEIQWVNESTHRHTVDVPRFNLGSQRTSHDDLKSTSFVGWFTKDRRVVWSEAKVLVHTSILVNFWWIHENACLSHTHNKGIQGCSEHMSYHIYRRPKLSSWAIWSIEEIHVHHTMQPTLHRLGNTAWAHESRWNSGDISARIREKRGNALEPRSNILDAISINITKK